MRQATNDSQKIPNDVTEAARAFHSAINSLRLCQDYTAQQCQHGSNHGNICLTASRNGWMTSEKFPEWVARIWGPNCDDVLRLLILDWAPIYKIPAVNGALEEGNMDVLFVPANCTSLLQPADVY
ncbi:hypothetical protein HPB49_024814 [Dermacentor silvarum]|uniref:Uncharacterized protein n=1 Tax=Dermacentor silvarum TaxID=543639 RepID=A0ACB8D111_DERSI|nr:hypothetical protein HPB49_024814 [Dermacentor silvarum]